jgi:hypothetical protein
MGTFSGFVIPAESRVGDFAYLSGIESNVMILDETMKIYGGARRTAIGTSFRSNNIQLTYYWDKQTGVMLEQNITQNESTTFLKIADTNIWQTNLNSYPPTKTFSF